MSTETKQEDLKPCPFCGVLPELIFPNDIRVSHKGNCYIYKISTIRTFQLYNQYGWNARASEPQSSSLSFDDGITAMTRHSLAAVKLVESGRWTVVRMKAWLTACLTQDIKFLTNEFKPNLHPIPTSETNSGLDEILEQQRKENVEMKVYFDERILGLRLQKEEIIKERDIAQQRLIKLAKRVQADIAFVETRPVREMASEILSGNFEPIDKMV